MELLVERFTTSFNEAHQRFLERVDLGVQPFPDVRLYIVYGIAVYLAVTAVLYMVMSAPTRVPFSERFSWFKHVIVVYNVSCVCMAAYCAIGYAYLKQRYNWPSAYACNDGEVADDIGRMSAHLILVFFAQKFWEFQDTWFFILRKSWDQVSFLHVYHHASIVVVIGMLAPYNFSGDIYLPVVANSVVHVIMYSYYALTALGYKKITRLVKPYLTTIQLVQFVAIAYQNTVIYMRGDECSKTSFVSISLVAYMITMLILFGNFFVRSYIMPSKNAATPSKAKKIQ